MTIKLTIEEEAQVLADNITLSTLEAELQDAKEALNEAHIYTTEDDGGALAHVVAVLRTACELVS